MFNFNFKFTLSTILNTKDFKVGGFLKETCYDYIIEKVFVGLF